MPGFYSTRGDNVHISRTPPTAASGHGWWDLHSDGPTHADVTVQLQINRGGSWVNVGAPGTKRVLPGGGSGNRATARVECASLSSNEWRSEIDVDVVGYADTPDRETTPPQTLDCGA